MTTTQWNPFPSNMFQFNAGHPSAGNIQHSYMDTPTLNLKRRAARVVKTTSAGTSPHTIGRRKTTAVHGSARQRLLLDSHQSSVSESNIPTFRTSRPVSWHPSSFAASNSSFPMSNSRSPDIMQGQSMATNITLPPESNFHTASVNGVVTPLSFPYPDDLLPAEMFSTLDGYQGWAGQNPFQPQKEFVNFTPSGSFWPQMGMMTTPSAGHQLQQEQVANTFQYMPGSSHVHMHQTMPHFSAPQQLASTAPPTPDFLPIQNFSKEVENEAVLLVQKDDGQKEELVGMGLYDGPDESGFLDPSLEEYMYLTRLDATGLTPQPMGKGLKLEETFNPSSIEEDEDDEEDADYESDDNDEEDQTMQPAISRQPQTTSVVPNLSNHTFFFESDETASNFSTFGPNPQIGSQWVPSGSAPYGWI